MAYIKYKELTQYFNFYQELDIHTLPNYVQEYINEKETMLVAYATTCDKFVLTDQKIILFDVRGMFRNTKRIHFFPFCSISSTALEFKKNKVAILLSMDSGYQLRINFVKMHTSDKNKIKTFYMTMVNNISKEQKQGL